MPSPDRVPVGRIVGIFGIRGQVKVQALTDFPERFEPGRSLLLDDEPRKIKAAHWHKMQVRLTLEGISTVEAAEEIRGKTLYVTADDLPELEQDEYLTRDLIGLEVIDVNHGRLGKVDRVLGGAAQDLLEVGSILIPTVKQFIKSVNLKEGRIEVELIEGMRPGETPEEA